MTREVLETDSTGHATVIVFRETGEDRHARLAAQVEQEERGREVAAALRNRARARARRR